MVIILLVEGGRESTDEFDEFDEFEEVDPRRVIGGGASER